jgi:D-alanyl-lipoteichoic acid acyltransferase DltB (MBOAT superfamily)
MLFNSFVFVAFFAATYPVYLLLQGRLRAQNAMLVIAGCVFYGYWDWRFLLLLVFSTVVDFFLANAIHASSNPRTRKLLMLVSVGSGLTILGFFKYFNFFADSFVRAVAVFGWHPDVAMLQVILPLGISFYTFETMSYTIDVYRRQLVPTRSLLDYAVFISFYPHLVAGPIMRAHELLPQITARRRIGAADVNAGLFLILWGYFKKVVVADNVGVIANQVFNAPGQYHGMDITLGVAAFAVQIYGDFSGYTDIARGLARLMGFDLGINFNLPYFALSPSDFWRRWHISLSTWLRDYLFIPLGGSRGGAARTSANLMITMVLGGLWHGAAWHFVAWGAYHGALLVLYRLVDRDPVEMDLWSGHRSKPYVLAKMAVMFVFTLIGWVLFRAMSLGEAWHILTQAGWQFSSSTLQTGYTLAFFTLPLVAMECWQYAKRDVLAPAALPIGRRRLMYTAIVVGLCAFGVRESLKFIYFQF